MKTMKILISAYACEPHKGSEPAVGWNWAFELAQAGHEVWVITRENNRPHIEKALFDASLPNLHFLYFDLPRWLCFWKKRGRFVHLYYFLWQVGAFLAVRKQKLSFDLVHHVTFVSVRQPSLMGLLGIPFLFGPVAGGEAAPWKLRKSFPFRAQCRDLFRDLVDWWVRFDPLMWLTFAKADRIVVTSPQTKALLPKRFREKSLVRLAIGIDSDLLGRGERMPPERAFRLLFVGQLLYWKGLHLALRAFARFSLDHPECRFSIVGSGPDEKWLRAIAPHLEDRIDWIPWMDRADLMRHYEESDILLFPSLRDSGGMVVLEAMAHGLPVVCLDLGGPGVLVDERCGIRVETGGKSEADVVQGLVEGLERLADDPAFWMDCSRGAKQRAHEYSWPSIVRGGYGEMGINASNP